MKIWTPLLRETKEKLERGIRVKRSIQESPWNLTFASVNGYDFLNNMQMKKTQTFPPTKRASSNRRLVSVLWGVYASGQRN